ncbi:hypothetical protein Hanom_Chr16g01509541 [Helianthus anomalus]
MGRKQLQIPRRAQVTICRDNGGVQSNCCDMTCGFVVVAMVGYTGELKGCKRLEEQQWEEARRFGQ